MALIPEMRSKLNIKEMIRGKVRFDFYRDGNLYYRTENGVIFPVPVSEAGTATFLAEDKAILFMRYMRRFITSMEVDENGHVATD